MVSNTQMQRGHALMDNGWDKDDIRWFIGIIIGIIFVTNAASAIPVVTIDHLTKTNYYWGETIKITGTVNACSCPPPQYFLHGGLIESYPLNLRGWDPKIGDRTLGYTSVPLSKSVVNYEFTHQLSRDSWKNDFYSTKNPITFPPYVITKGSPTAEPPNLCIDGIGYASQNITIELMPIIVDAGPDQTVNVGDTVKFEGSFSPGFDSPYYFGGMTIFGWDFQDPDHQTGETTHIYDKEGTYIETLRLQNEIGTYTDTVTINVVKKGVAIPEFPTVALPIISIIGLVILFQRRKGK